MNAHAYAIDTLRQAQAEQLRCFGADEISLTRIAELEDAIRFLSGEEVILDLVNAASDRLDSDDPYCAIVDQARKLVNTGQQRHDTTE